MNQNIVEYFNWCQRFDWFYDWSDDFRVYSSGRSIQQDLIKQYEIYPYLRPIYEAWKQYNFSGKEFGTEKCLVPHIEDFIKGDNNGHQGN
jgi:hypothetical protein